MIWILVGICEHFGVNRDCRGSFFSSWECGSLPPNFIGFVPFPVSQCELKKTRNASKVQHLQNLLT